MEMSVLYRLVWIISVTFIASCKESRKDPFSMQTQNFSSGISDLAGFWTSGCRLHEFEDNIFAYETNFSIEGLEFVSTISYYNDGGCKDLLFSEIKRGNLEEVKLQDIKFVQLILESSAFALHNAELVEQYNQLNVFGKTWQLGREQELELDVSSDSRVWATIQSESEMAFKLLPQPPKEIVKNEELEGLRFIKSN